MRNFYQRNKVSDLPTPAVLGITATPSITVDFESIKSLETLLDAKCVTPTLHRAELLQYVKRPRLETVQYIGKGLLVTESMQRLRHEFLSLDITDDPYILELQRNPSDRNRRALERAIEKKDTFVQNSIRTLINHSNSIANQLGSWAADLYIWKAISAFLNRVEGRKDTVSIGWTDPEKLYLANFLRRVSPQRPPSAPQTSHQVSGKGSALVSKLRSIEEPVVCLIFVQERATVPILCDLLASCPGIAQKHRIKAMVSSSSIPKKCKHLAEPFDERERMALEDFRSGKVNILVATSVLEEGIDVPACNTVICFDSPPTPKAFIQRRGRARMQDSRLILFCESLSPAIENWERWEDDLQASFRDTESAARQLQQLEILEETSCASLEVRSTGARIDIDNSKTHLDHFCMSLHAGEFVDHRPEYIIHKHWDSSQLWLSATVILPLFLPPALRRINGEGMWLSEKNATKDAALQAYKAVHAAGLVDDHLLPFKFHQFQCVESRESSAEVEGLVDPWVDIRRGWEADIPELWLYSMSLEDDRGGNTDFGLVLPCALPDWRLVPLYIDESETCHFRCTSRRLLSTAEAKALPDHTSALLALHFSHRFPIRDERHVVQIFVSNLDISMKTIGARAFDPGEVTNHSQIGLLRSPWGSLSLYLGMLESKPAKHELQRLYPGFDEVPDNVPHVLTKKWTKRSDFLHPLLNRPKHPEHPATSKRIYGAIPLSATRVDSVPVKYAKLGMLIPSLLHELEIMMITQKAALSLTKKPPVTDPALWREAISSTEAHEPVNYERLEFLGDAVLKFCTALQLLADRE